MILGLDPGSYKIGWALVSDEGELLLSGIVAAGGLDALLAACAAPQKERLGKLTPYLCENIAAADGEISLVVLGNGTHSRETAAAVAGCGYRTVTVDERNTTLAARGLYWRLHGPAWWQWLLPLSMRVPPRPLDDLAAWAIAMRGIAAEKRS